MSTAKGFAVISDNQMLVDTIGENPIATIHRFLDRYRSLPLRAGLRDKEIFDAWRKYKGPGVYLHEVEITLGPHAEPS